MIADALDTLWTLGWAALAWLLVLSAACALVLTTITAALLTLGRAVKAAWVRLRGRDSAELPPNEAPQPQTPHTPAQRPTPAWAHTDKEAA